MTCDQPMCPNYFKYNEKKPHIWLLFSICPRSGGFMDPTNFNGPFTRGRLPAPSYSYAEWIVGGF